MTTSVMLFVAVTFFGLVSSQQLSQPEQVHLSFGDHPTQMLVTWVTRTFMKAPSIVEYGQGNFSLKAKGAYTKFVDGGKEKRVLYMHRVTLTGLSPGKKYVYHVGSSLGWSDMFFFTAMKPGQDWSVRFVVFGDMGNDNAQSLGRLQEETQRGHFDAILHVGDFAYDMDSDNARVGDAYMNQVQSIAAYVPYMTCAGNHENAYNFSNYMNRFTMPGGDGHGMFYSFNIGKAHVVAFSSEYYYFTKYGWMQIARQYEWLENDLKEANLPENRSKRPWIITMCHRPMYCTSSNDAEHCQNKENIIRVGLPGIHAYGMEDMLYKYGVDLHLQAHEHTYERFWPVYNLTVCNGSVSEPYTNPTSPVHIITGSAGCHEGVDPFEPYKFPWSSFASDDYGYTRMNVINDTHLYLEQVSDDQDGKVIDKMTLVRDKHHAGMYDCHLKNKKT